MRAADELVVVDDLPVFVPVAVRELDVIETYLGALLDRLFADAAEPAATRSSSARPGSPDLPSALERD